MEGLKEIFEKVSSYNIFNYLLPGIVFVVICKMGLNIDLVMENNFLGAFLYYFIGLVVSRVGSVIVEPFLKWLNILKFSDYKNYVKASKQDEKIELLSEVNNSYRTILSLLLILFSLKIYKHYNFLFWHIPHNISYSILLLIMLVIFILSYKKQTKYITKRIEANLNP